jgi:hypothetical protein
MAPPGPGNPRLYSDFLAARPISAVVSDSDLSRCCRQHRTDMSSTPPHQTTSIPAATEETFTASRWTRGNLWFPTRIVVSPLRVSRVRRRLFGSDEESISIPQVASVKISTGMVWSEIRIESSGGTDPITSHGHRKADALRIRDLVESYQAGRR